MFIAYDTTSGLLIKFKKTYLKFSIPQTTYCSNEYRLILVVSEGVVTDPSVPI